MFLAAIAPTAACGLHQDNPAEDDSRLRHKQAFAEPPSDKTHAPDPQSQARIVLLGTGTPTPDPFRSGPATAVIAGGRAYLVDCGPGVVRRASEAFLKGITELDVRQLTLVFVTHLHSDHTAGYPDLILTPAAAGRSRPLKIYGPPGIKAMTEKILAAYKEDLAVRAKGRSPSQMRGYRVEAHEVVPGVVYKDENIKVTAFAVRHGVWKNAYGYRFDTPQRSIVISGDTGPTEATIEACRGCDVLVHEVYCKSGFDQGPWSWQQYHATHHTSSQELARLAVKARPKLLVLYHQLFFECSEEQLLDEIRSLYKGRVVSGNDLDVY